MLFILFLKFQSYWCLCWNSLVTLQFQQFQTGGDKKQEASKSSDPKTWLFNSLVSLWTSLASYQVTKIIFLSTLTAYQSISIEITHASRSRSFKSKEQWPCKRCGWQFLGIFIGSALCENYLEKLNAPGWIAIVFLANSSAKVWLLFVAKHDYLLWGELLKAPVIAHCPQGSCL